MDVMDERRPGTVQEVVATFATYAEAQRAVDHVSGQQFLVEHTAIG